MGSKWMSPSNPHSTFYFILFFLQKHTAFLKHLARNSDSNNFLQLIRAIFLIDPICPVNAFANDTKLPAIQMVTFQVSAAAMTGERERASKRASERTNLLRLAAIQSPLIKSLHSPPVFIGQESARSRFAFWCLHHCNCVWSRRALLMRPYGKNKPNNMHAKQMPSGAQRTHGLIIFTRGVSHLHRQEVASGCLISSDWEKNARRREQGDNYTLCQQICVSAPFFFLSHIQNGPLPVLEPTVTVYTRCQRSILAQLAS